MNQNVKPLHAVLIVFSALAMISLIFFTRSEMLQLGGPDQMQFDAQGNLYIHISGDLYKLDPEMKLLARFNLSQFDVYDLVGDFAFFSNGDLLIRRGEYKPKFAESLRRFMRQADANPPLNHSQTTGLVRCKLESSKCKLFSTDEENSHLDFHSAFHIAMDWSTDTVYISDTDRHTLRKYSSDGTPLAIKEHGVRYPNQITLHKNKLLLADTNHHAIQEVETVNETFGSILVSHKVNHESLKQARWPFAFAQVGNQWWVNNMQGNMQNGSIVVFSDTWDFVKALSLPEKADPIDIAVLEQQVLISDLANIRIHVLNHAGEVLPNQLPQTIANKLSALQGKQANLRMMGYATVTLFVIMLMGGIGLAVLKVRRTPEEFASHTESIDIDNPEIQWVRRNKKQTQLLWLTALIPVILLPFIGIVFYNKPPAGMQGPIILIAVVLVALPVIFYYHLRAAIGTLDGLLIIKKTPRNYAAASGKNIIYSDHYILIGNTSIAFRQQQIFFRLDDIVNQVMPLLQDATYIKHEQMLSLLLKRMRPAPLALLLIGAAVLMALVFRNVYQ